MEGAEVVVTITLACGAAGTAAAACYNFCREWAWKRSVGLDKEGLEVYEYVTELNQALAPKIDREGSDEDASFDSEPPPSFSAQLSITAFRMVSGTKSSTLKVTELQPVAAGDNLAFPPPLERMTSLPEGRELHNSVPAENWAVTRADFLAFVRLAHARWKDGNIPDNEEFPFPGHNSERIGPNIYQVNEHFIKPVTRDAGGMSWALMCHPKGLTCDLFVSHAWSEGLFEFTRHLARSWPWKAQHLWCCFLANPQCLDMADILNVPLDKSPFARALRTAPEFLVVPNSASSIYNRLWCVYEISLAMKQEKTIAMPTAELGDVLDVFIHTYGRCIACIGIGAVIRWILAHVFPEKFGGDVGASLLSWPTLATVSLWRWSLDGRMKYAIYVLFFFIGFLGGGLHRLFFFIIQSQGTESEVECISGNCFSWWNFCLEVIALPCLLFTFAASGIYDEVYHGIGAQLRHRTVRRAMCSNADDQAKILDAIKGREGTIDIAVRTLIKAGNFNNSLVEMGQRGFPLETLRYNPASFVLPLPATFLGLMLVVTSNSIFPATFDTEGMVAHSMEQEDAHMGAMMAVKVFYVVQFAALVAIWARALCHSARWQRCLWLRRMDQTAWMVCGAYYVMYSYERCSNTLGTDWMHQRLHHKVTVFCAVDNSIAKVFRGVLVAPLWLVMPLWNSVWNGSEQGLKFSCCVIIFMALMHLKAIIGRSILLYAAQASLRHTIQGLGTINVVISFFLIFWRVSKERWKQQRILIRRVRLISGLSLILSDLVLRIKVVDKLCIALDALFQWKSGSVRLAVGEALHLLSPVVNLMALYDPLWEDHHTQMPQSFARVLSINSNQGGMDIPAPSSAPLLDEEDCGSCHFGGLPDTNVGKDEASKA